MASITLPTVNLVFSPIIFIYHVILILPGLPITERILNPGSSTFCFLHQNLTQVCIGFIAKCFTLGGDGRQINPE